MQLYDKITQPLLNVGSDKYLHLIISLLIAFILTVTFGWVVGVGVTLLIGIFKEAVIDLLIRKQKFDDYDVAADIVGAVIGTVMAIY